MKYKYIQSLQTVAYSPGQTRFIHLQSKMIMAIFISTILFWVRGRENKKRKIYRFNKNRIGLESTVNFIQIYPMKTCSKMIFVGGSLIAIRIYIGQYTYEFLFPESVILLKSECITSDKSVSIHRVIITLNIHTVRRRNK